MRTRLACLRGLLHFTLPLLSTVVLAGWSRPLTPVVSSADRAVMDEDSRAMGRFFQSSPEAEERGYMRMDMAEDVQYRFVLNRLRAAGKTPENSPYLFEQLRAQRQKDLARRAGGGTKDAVSTLSSGWWCDHMLALTGETVSGGVATFRAGPTGSCKGGANYAYIDVAAYDSNLEGTSATLQQFQAMEQFNLGTNLNGLEVQPSLSTSGFRVAVFDSMMVADNYTTGESITYYSRLGSTALPVPPDTTLSHPRRAPQSPNNDIMLCQLRGGSDCDYAVVNSSYVPYASPITGVALRQSAYPWHGDPAHYFPMGAAYNYDRLYVPLEFTFHSGSTGGGACSLQSFHVGTAARLIKTETGGSCSVVSGLREALTQQLSTLAANNRQSITYRALEDFSRYLNPDMNPCTTPSITNEAVNLLVTVTSYASCGGVSVPRTRTFSLFRQQNRKLYFLNSCMAEGTRVLRADGTSDVVENIRVGDKVVADDKGRVLTVTDVAHGGEPKPLVRLRDSLGHEVSLTEQHPVLLASGRAVPASTLEPGSKVRTRRGVSTLVSVERVSYEGQVYNLTLGTRQELARASAHQRTLYANGFLVGDNALQTLLSTPTRREEATLASLPAVWHRDYLLSRAAARQVR